VFTPDLEQDDAPPVGTLSPEALALFEELLNSGLNLRLRVTGRSMRPFLQGNEVLTIGKAPGNSLRLGDLLLVRGEDGAALLHRLLRKTRDAAGRVVFQTKGDALLGLDPPTPECRVLAKVLLVIKPDGRGGWRKIDMASKAWRAANFFLAMASLLKPGWCLFRRRLFDA
jgi:hypothetical protein